MEITWSPAASKAWYKAARYCEKKFGRRVADRFAERTSKMNRLLAANPRLGKEEPLLEKHSKAYRSLVLDEHYKVIYYLAGSTVYVIALWDVRRDPDALADRIR